MTYEWDNKKPTAQMLGRWQPWHEGHQKLFEEILKKTGQVNILIVGCVQDQVTPNTTKMLSYKVMLILDSQLNMYNITTKLYFETLNLPYHIVIVIISIQKGNIVD